MQKPPSTLMAVTVKPRQLTLSLRPEQRPASTASWELMWGLREKRLQQAHRNRPSLTERRWSLRFQPGSQQVHPSCPKLLIPPQALPFNLPAPTAQPCPVVKFLPSQREVAELLSSGKRTDWLRKKSLRPGWALLCWDLCRSQQTPPFGACRHTRPTLWLLCGGLAWPPPPSQAHLCSPSGPPYQTLSYSPKTLASPSSAPLLELFLYLEYFILFIYWVTLLIFQNWGRCLLNPQTHTSACQGHRTSLTASQISPPSSPRSPHSITLGSFPSLKQWGTPCPRAFVLAIPPAWHALLPTSWATTPQSSPLLTNGGLLGRLCWPLFK